MWGGGWSEKTVGGRGWGAPLCQLLYEPGEMVWQYIYFQILLKRDFYLQRFKSEGLQKPEMWRWCSQIASDYMEYSFNPLHLASAPSQLRPLFSELLLIATLVNPAHGTQGCPKIISFDKNHWHFNFWLILFRSHFSLLFNTRTFFAITPCRKNTLPFFFQSSIWDPFPAFFLVTVFYSFLINVPIIHIEGFWNLPVNPARRVPGFMEEKGR